MDIRVTRTTEAPAARPQRWWATLGLLLLLPGLLSGSRATVEASPRSDETPRLAEDVFPVGEWIRVRGAPSVEALPLPRPQWGVRPVEVPETPAAQLLAGNTQGLDLSGVLVELDRLLDTFEARRSAAAFSAAGGETRLVGEYLPPWMWADGATIAEPQRQLSVTLPPLLDGRARTSGLAAWVDGVNYGDPTGVGLPLRRASGFEQYRLTEHFSVRDFATRDNAPYVRIAPDLVAGLQHLRREIGPVRVISGYRHPAYNARDDVGGAYFSRHQAGQAADIVSSTRTTLEMAQAAVRTLGCGIGLGLGATSLHVDVRGYLSTWTYPGAPVSEAAFDRWILSLCGGSAPQAPTLSRTLTHDEWLAIAAGGTQDDEERVHLSEEAVEEAVEAAAPAPARRQIAPLDLAAVARDGFARDGAGVVVVDLRDGAVPEGRALRRRARYVRAVVPEARALGLERLVAWVQSQSEGAYFVYAVRRPGGAVESGVASTTAGPPPVALPPLLDASPLPPLDASREGGAASGPAAPAQPGAPEPPAADEAPRWLVLVATVPTLDAVDREVAYVQALVDARALTASLYLQGSGPTLRYRVAVGPFDSRRAARRAREQLRALVEDDPEIVEQPRLPR